MTSCTLTTFLIGTGCSLIIGACLGSIAVAILNMAKRIRNQINQAPTIIEAEE